MSTKVKGTEGIEFPDATVQASAAYAKNEFRSGQVLQIVTHFDVGSGATVSNWVSLTTVPATITPKSANSKLIVQCLFSGSVNPMPGINAEAYFQLNNGSVPSGIGGNFIAISSPSASGGIGASGGVGLQWVVPNTTLTAKSFSVTAYPNVGTPNLIGASQQAWQITEVQN